MTKLSSYDENLRLDCLRAVGGDVFNARQAYEFVSGQSDLTPRQRIEAALKEIEGADATGS